MGEGGGVARRALPCTARRFPRRVPPSSLLRVEVGLNQRRGGGPQVGFTETQQMEKRVV